MALRHCNNTVWQWNCRGFSRKRAVLQSFLTNGDRPEVIAVQECGKNAKLAGYKSYTGSNNDTQVTTFVKRNITTLQHETGNAQIDHVLVELIPRKRKDKNLFILNVYSSPKQRKCDFGDLFTKTKVITKSSPLLVVGDFNAHHPAWGYKFTQVKGRNLWDKIQQHGLILITDPMKPTRKGNSVSADTTPDLTLVGSGVKATWCNTGEDLGSDHRILEIIVENGPPVINKRIVKATNWDAFRRIRSGQDPINNIDDWSKGVIQSVQDATEEIELEDDQEAVDGHLVSLWKKKKELERKISQKRGDRNLRKKLAALNKEIEEYALELAKQNWGNICDQMDMEIGSAATWRLLRHLLDPEKTKSEARQQLQKLVYKYQGPTKELLTEVRDRYLNCAGVEVLPDYAGSENPDLDSPITVAEVRAEINRLRTKTAAGPDKISNRMLRNLDAGSIGNLATYMQDCWDKGEIPQAWKAANLVFIPKPGKKLSFEHLRPISITSCVGKLMEHVIQTRLNRFMEDQNLYPDTMIGFRTNLSVCDVMLQIKEQIIYKKTIDTRVIVGLDVSKAFDNVKHAAILQNLSALNVGVKTYNYVKNFLSNRTATISLGGQSLENIKLGNRGTPQGSVLSPTLFNVAMMGLPGLLDEITNLHYTIYADDLTLWVNRGSDGQIENTLQRAIDTIEKYLEPIGLKCSAEKSEALFLPYQKRKRNSPPCKNYDIALRVNGNDIPTVESIRVLGLRIQTNGKNTETIRRLEASTSQTCRLLKRISNKHAGMKEANLLRLFQAFVISRVLFVAPYLKLGKAEKDKIDIILRKGIKTALGLPPNTPTVKLLRLGVSNTLDELIEGATVSQHQRLLRSKTGRKIMERLGFEPSQCSKQTDIVPRPIRNRLMIPPLPKNMHPVFHEGRRKNRTMALQAKFGGRSDVLYTDAAEYDRKTAHTAVVVRESGDPVSCCTVRNSSATEAEEVAIALAMGQSGTRVIVSDSKAAIKNYDMGRVSAAAAKILREGQVPAEQISLIWCPAHQGMWGNEKAHATARGLTFRSIAADSPPPREEPLPSNEELRTFQEIICYYKLGRKTYPAPHKQLSRNEEVMWRKLQTGVFPNPQTYSKWHPEVFNPRCTHCDSIANLAHMVWTCPSYNDPNRNVESWETLLLNHKAEEQRKVIGLALAAAESQGIPADG